MKKQLALIVLSLPFASACGKDDSKGDVKAEVSAAAFLAPADVAPGANIKPLDKETAKSTIETDSSLMDDTPDDTTPATGSSKCFEDALNAVKVKSGKTSLAIVATLDLKACLSASDDLKSQPDATLTVANATMHLAFGAGCPGEDFAQFDGKTFKEISADGKLDHLCEKGETRSILTNTELSFEFASAATIGTTQVNVKYVSHSTSAQATVAMDACTDKFDGTFWVDTTDCVHSDRSDAKTTTTVTGQAEKVVDSETYSKLLSSGLKSKGGKGSPWYAGGKLAVTYNDWTGVVTYTDAATPPTYTLAKGAESLSGTVVGVKATLTQSLTARARARFAAALAPMKR